MSEGLYDALRAAGLDLEHAHRLDASLRGAGGDAAAGLLRTLGGDPGDAERLRAALRADLAAISSGLALLDAWNPAGWPAFRPVSHGRGDATR